MAVSLITIPEQLSGNPKASIAYVRQLKWSAVKIPSPLHRGRRPKARENTCGKCHTIYAVADGCGCETPCKGLAECGCVGLHPKVVAEISKKNLDLEKVSSIYYIVYHNIHVLI